MRDDQQRRKLFQILNDYIVTHRSRLVNRIFFHDWRADSHATLILSSAPWEWGGRVTHGIVKQLSLESGEVCGDVADDHCGVSQLSS